MVRAGGVVRRLFDVLIDAELGQYRRQFLVDESVTLHLLVEIAI